ncbi:MAG: hypothetical protein IKG30_00425 [Clostridiales bacterium]|nr:hypothetical protein [Clostridiales bacterium]
MSDYISYESLDLLEHAIADDCINEFINDRSCPSPNEKVNRYMQVLSVAVDLKNQDRPKGMKWRCPTEPDVSVIVKFLATFHQIIKVPYYDTNNTDEMELAMYQDAGDYEGTYTNKKDVFFQVVRRYLPSINKHQFQEILFGLLNSESVPVKQLTKLDYLVPVNNGVFDMRSKTLLGYEECQRRGLDYVFVKKIRIDFGPVANPIIHNPTDGTDWDVESWMGSLSDDPDTVKLLWQVVASVVRVYKDYQKTILFYSESGSNGKGTLCALLRGLVTDSESISILEFSDEYALSNIFFVNAIICDENSVGSFAKASSRFKAAVSGDPFMVNRKYLPPITGCFYGRIIECVNELPRFADFSDSILRRLLIVNFSKRFEDGEKKRYIKTDYLKRPEVLQYVLYKVLFLMDDFDEFDVPEASNMLLREVRLYNDNIAAFLDEILDQLSWDLVPFGFLHLLYIKWLKLTSPASTPEKKQKFINHIRQLWTANPNPYWEVTGDNPVKVAHRMDKPEFLISTFGITEWKRQGYTGNDLGTLCTPNVDAQQVFRGIIRKEGGINHV